MPVKANVRGEAMILLSEVEARVLGCLMEKQVITPEYYPLSLNALTLACNQKSSRDPVVEYDEKTVVRGLDGLREKKLAWMVHGPNSRVPKYEHRLPEALPLSPDQHAVLCLLLLRGPQTPGELRTRSGRLHLFGTNADVEVALHQLASRTEGALVTKLPLLPRTHEHRHQHLLCGEPVAAPVEPAPPPPPEAARVEVEAENVRLARLEEQVAALRGEIEDLKAQFASFRQQFE
jgi:uncharacterized protein YceH (UPF0502 family)